MMLDHVTFRTADLEGTRLFLEQLLNLTAGYRPAFDFPGYWLYQGDKQVIHLVPGRPTPVDGSGEGIDHVGLFVSGYADYVLRLERSDTPFSRMDLPELNERRLFVRTPNGILLELIFRE